MHPERLGRYAVEGILGRGGMGAVYAARNLDTGEPAALKVLVDLGVDEPERFRRFEQEVEALRRLSHENVVRLTGPLERDGDVVFFAMERLAGETLAARLRREGPLPSPQALSIARALFAALDAAHRAGIVHRDVKPSNLLLDGERVVLTDFGLARASDLTRLTRTGQLMGTLAYMSPEQCEGGEIDHRSDLYSAGVVLYEMLTGAPPFANDSPGAVLRSHLREAPTRPDRIRADLPPGLADVVVRLLAKRPADRPADARAVLAELERIRDPASSVTFRPGRGPAPAAGAPAAGGRRRPVVLAAGAAVLIAAAAGAAIALWPDAAPPGPEAAGPDRSSVESVLAAVHAAIGAADFAAFSACFTEEALLEHFGEEMETEFRARAAKASDLAFRAELPLRGAAEGGASIRHVAGPALPTVLGFDPGELLRVAFTEEGGEFAIADARPIRPDALRPAGGPGRIERDVRLLAGRVEAVLRGLAAGGGEILRRRLPPERQTQLDALLARGPLRFEVLPEECRVGAAAAEIVVRIPDLAQVLGLSDDRFEVRFTRSRGSPQWRSEGVRPRER